MVKHIALAEIVLRFGPSGSYSGSSVKNICPASNLSVTYTCLYLFTIQLAGACLNRSVEIPFDENTQCFDLLLQSSAVPGNVTMGL